MARPVVTRADIDVAMGYIERHACNSLTPGRVIAETQRVTLATFQRHFIAATGLTLEAAIRLRQLEEVRRLILRTELSPQFIAEQCGFPDIGSAAGAFTAAGCEVPHALREPRPSTASISSRQTDRRE
ncbi:MAG: AraC family transcriptional regulator [Luteolibacter sp.]